MNNVNKTILNNLICCKGSEKYHKGVFLLVLFNNSLLFVIFLYFFSL